MLCIILLHEFTNIGDQIRRRNMDSPPSADLIILTFPPKIVLYTCHHKKKNLSSEKAKYFHFFPRIFCGRANFFIYDATDMTGVKCQQNKGVLFCGGTCVDYLAAIVCIGRLYKRVYCYRYGSALRRLRLILKWIGLIYSYSNVQPPVII